MRKNILLKFIISASILILLFPQTSAAQSGRVIDPNKATNSVQCDQFKSQGYVWYYHGGVENDGYACIKQVDKPVTSTKPEDAKSKTECDKYKSQGYVWEYTGGAGADGLGYSCIKKQTEKPVDKPVDKTTTTTVPKTDAVQLGGCPDANYEKIPGGICVPKQKEITGIDCNSEANKGSPVCIRTFGSLLATILRYLLGFSAVIATIFIVYGGYVYMTAGGEADNTKKGKDIATAAVIGLVITMLAWAIITIVTRFVTERAF